MKKNNPLLNRFATFKRDTTLLTIRHLQTQMSRQNEIPPIRMRCHTTPHRLSRKAHPPNRQRYIQPTQ
eukprot:CCRYP_020464-RB/>CCRYP_020464-RB protein AED:0.48 eAED:0.90 QI:0/0/0/1/0/0/2/0/67